MIDLLVMPLSKAKTLIPLWNNTRISTGIIMAICFVVWVVTMFCMCLLTDKYNKKKKYVSYWVKLVFTSIICVISFCTLFIDMPNVDSVRTKNIGAINNVSCYYKMRHLRKIYHTLPCKPYKKKICKTGSITKANHYRYKSKHILTKPKATREYAKMKKAYRKSANSIGYNESTQNGTQSLKPRAPRWWNYIWN